MQNKRQSAYFSALFFNTFAFTVCFAGVVFSVLAVPLADLYSLTHFEKGLLVSAPIFLGSVLRFPMGALTDRWGPQVTFPLVMGMGALAAFGASFTHNYWQLLACGFFLGLVGTSFIVGICSVSDRTSLKNKGFALGVFAAGNVGSMVTTLFAPAMVVRFGWETTFQIYSVLLLASSLIYWLYFTLLDRDFTPTVKAQKQSWQMMKSSRPYRFGAYYFITFGGFVTFTLFLPQFYTETYKLSLSQAGLYTALFALVASLIRPFGGFLSDKIGARKTLSVCLGIITMVSFLLASLPLHPISFVLFTLVMGLAMGTGSAAVFKYIPQYFPHEVGMVGGFVGAVGGLGGFFFPPLFGFCRDLFQDFGAGMMLFGGVALFTLLWQFAAVREIKRVEMAKAAV